jgi:hypothetical protein
MIWLSSKMDPVEAPGSCTAITHPIVLGDAMPASTIAGERIRALAGEGVPGIAVLVAGPEGVRAAGAAGLADIAGQVPASPDMVCPWFSMTRS